jgi:glycosyltransferase involved in cell wall biosynthesis
VIVVDDGSTDGTPAILAAYGDAIRWLRREENRGIYPTTWEGIGLARGELLALYHADDVYLPEMMARQVEFLDRWPEAGAIFASDIFVDGSGAEYDRLRLPPEVRGERPLPFATLFEAILNYKNRQLRTPSAMLRAGVARELGGFRHDLFGACADFDAWLRILARHPIGILETHLFRYRHHDQATHRRDNLLRTEMEPYFAIVDHHLARGATASRRARVAYEAHRAEYRLRLGVNRYILGDLAAARRELAQVGAGRLVASPRVQRWRLLVLLAAFRILARLPRSAAVAAAMKRRWYPWAPC